jgi:hypothetical protein
MKRHDGDEFMTDEPTSFEICFRFDVVRVLTLCQADSLTIRYLSYMYGCTAYHLR